MGERKQSLGRVEGVTEGAGSGVGLLELGRSHLEEEQSPLFHVPDTDTRGHLENGLEAAKRIQNKTE